MIYSLLRELRNPRRAGIIIAALLMIPLVLLAAAGALASSMEHWTPIYDSAAPLLVFAGVIILFALMSALWPRVQLRSLQRINDDPHEITAYLTSVFVLAAALALVPGLLGYIGSYVFRDFRFYLASALVGLVSVVLWWPTSRTMARWEASLRARGVVQPKVEAPAAGWCADPSARHELRYWDGAAWTAHVSDAGVQQTDSL
jgi:hypothetical protein